MYLFSTLSRSLLLSAVTLSLSVLNGLHAADSQLKTPKPSDKELRKITLQVAPVGPRRLAQFGVAKQKPQSKKVTPKQVVPTEPSADGSTEQEVEIDGEKAAGGSTSFRVLDIPEDERPPRSLYVKTASNEYQQVICSFNSISPAIEFPIKGKQLVLYRKLPPKKPGRPFNYKAFADFELPEGNRNVLITITKPLKTKKWSKPIIAAHDLTNLENGSITVINTSDDQSINCQVNGQKKNLSKRRGRISYRSESGKKVARVVMTSQHGRRDEDTNALLPFHDGFYKVKPDQKMIILTYSVTKKESPKGAKFIRTSLDF